MLKTLIGDYPVTRQFRTRTDRFEFAQYQGSVASAFKRVVRNLEFDVAEMAIMTFLVAKAFKQALSSAAVVMARYQHPYLVTTQALSPKDLEGKRVGVRSYSVTTAPGFAAFWPMTTASISRRSSGSRSRSRTSPNSAIRRMYSARPQGRRSMPCCSPASSTRRS